MNGAGAEDQRVVSISGAQGRTQDFGAGSEEDLQQRMQEFRDRAPREAGLAGWRLRRARRRADRLGRMPKGFNINQPHGVLYFSDDNADWMLDPIR